MPRVFEKETLDHGLLNYYSMLSLRSPWTDSRERSNLRVYAEPPRRRGREKMATAAEIKWAWWSVTEGEGVGKETNEATRCYCVDW